VSYYIPPRYITIIAAKRITFLNVVDSVKAEVQKLHSEGVRKIFALGHAEHSTSVDVSQIEGVDVVVGTTSTSYVYKGTYQTLEYIYITHQDFDCFTASY